MGNSAPTVGAITVNNGADIYLTPCANTTVTCDVIVTDADGYEDINTSSLMGIFYSSDYSNEQDSDNRSIHYSNNSCTGSGGSGTTMNVVCNFTVDYYAMNGTWSCGIRATDYGGEIGSNLSNSTMDSLAAVSLNATQVQFGTGLSPGDNTSANPQTLMVTNCGNVQLDLNISGSNMTNEHNTEAHIPVNHIKYDTVSNAMSNTVNLSETATNVDFNLLRRVYDAGSSTKNIYWDLYVPLASEQYIPAGIYNGTITITGKSG